MTPSQQIRMLEPRDVPACMGIAALSWDRLIGGMAQADLNESFGTSPWRPVFYVAEVDGRVVGFAAYGCSWLGYCIYSITWVNVHPDFQRRGIGRALISRCLDDLKPIARVVILITENAAPLYQQFGFKPLAQYASESNGGKETLMALEFREAARSASGAEFSELHTTRVHVAPAPAETTPPHSWSYINTLIGWTCRHCGIADRGPHHSLPISGCSRPSPVSTPPDAAPLLTNRTCKDYLQVAPATPDAAQGKPPGMEAVEGIGLACRHGVEPLSCSICMAEKQPPAPQKCFWPQCSDRKRCAAHGSCVALAQAGGKTFTTTGESGLRECAFQVGDRVTVKHPEFGGDWPGEYTVTGIQWQYQRTGQLNISIASDDDIKAQHGDTDGWRPEHLFRVNTRSTPRAREEVPQIGDNGGWIYLSENSPSVKHAVQDTRVWLPDGTYIAGRRVGTEGPIVPYVFQEREDALKAEIERLEKWVEAIRSNSGLMAWAEEQKARADKAEAELGRPHSTATQADGGTK